MIDDGIYLSSWEILRNNHYEKFYFNHQKKIKFFNIMLFIAEVIYLTIFSLSGISIYIGLTINLIFILIFGWIYHRKHIFYLEEQQRLHDKPNIYWQQLEKFLSSTKEKNNILQNLNVTKKETKKSLL